MSDLLGELKKLDGQKCFTLTHNNPALMEVDDQQVTVIYPSGRSLAILRALPGVDFTARPRALYLKRD